MKFVVVFVVFIVFVSAAAPAAGPAPTGFAPARPAPAGPANAGPAPAAYPLPASPPAPTPPAVTKYRPDSSSCMRFHQVIKRNLAECTVPDILYDRRYCTFYCDGAKLRLKNCHQHPDEGLPYPVCSDLVCRDANSSDYPGEYCNELPVNEHTTPSYHF